MNITKINVFPTKDDKYGVLANCSATVDDCIYLTGIKLREGQNGMYIVFPSYKLSKPDKDGKEYKEYYFMKKDAKELLQTMIINAYRGQAENDIDNDNDLPF